MAGSHRHCRWRSMGAASAPRARHCCTVSACQAANAAAAQLSQAAPLTERPSPGTASLPLSPGPRGYTTCTGPGLQAALRLPRSARPLLRCSRRALGPGAGPGLHAASVGDASASLSDVSSGARVGSWSTHRRSGGAPWPGPRAVRACPAGPCSRRNSAGATACSPSPKGPGASAGWPPCGSGLAAAGGGTAVRMRALAARAATTVRCSLHTRKWTALCSSALGSHTICHGPAPGILLRNLNVTAEVGLKHNA